jgi:hypothetical protein
MNSKDNVCNNAYDDGPFGVLYCNKLVDENWCHLDQQTKCYDEGFENYLDSLDDSDENKYRGSII